MGIVVLTTIVNLDDVTSSAMAISLVSDIAHVDDEHRRTRTLRHQPAWSVTLGFTHICAEGPNGKFRVVRRTSRKKRNAKLASLKEEIERRKHHRVGEQHKWLNSVLRGHNLYYGVPGNYSALSSFRHHVRLQWHRSLQRRSQRAKWTDAKHKAFDARFPLLTPTITHQHPLSGLSRP